MIKIFDIFRNNTLSCAIITWFVAQFLKIPFLYLTKGVFSLHRFWGSGGMPSSHTAIIVATTNMIGALNGYNSNIFALSFVLSTIVMYDATGVRRQTGEQSTVIKEIIKRVFLEGESITDKELKELVGHTPLEVLGGAILGLIVSTIYLAFMN